MVDKPDRSASNGHANTSGRDVEDANIELVGPSDMSSSDMPCIQHRDSVLRSALNGRWVSPTAGLQRLNTHM